MSTTTVLVPIAEAQPGDQIRQAGELVTIERISFLHGNACITFVGGGYHSAPAHFYGQVLRTVTDAPAPMTIREAGAYTRSAAYGAELAEALGAELAAPTTPGLAVACPACGQPAGRPCADMRRAAGAPEWAGLLRKPHAARVAAAKGAGRRCDALVRTGTGVSICDAALDEHGQCPRAGQHVSELGDR